MLSQAQSRWLYEAPIQGPRESETARVNILLVLNKSAFEKNTVDSDGLGTFDHDAHWQPRLSYCSHRQHAAPIQGPREGTCSCHLPGPGLCLPRLRRLTSRRKGLRVLAQSGTASDVIRRVSTWTSLRCQWRVSKGGGRPETRIFINSRQHRAQDRSCQWVLCTCSCSLSTHRTRAQTPSSLPGQHHTLSN